MSGVKRPKPGSATPSVAEARAAAQEESRARRDAQTAMIEEHFAGGVPGSWMMNLARLCTVAFAVATAVAVVINARSTRVVSASVDLVLFGAGCVMFLVALYQGAQRSRDSEITMAGWWFLVGSAPRSVRTTLVGATVAQTVIGIVGASVRPFTALAFGVLVPTFGLALTGWWGALHGWFRPRRATS